jgi:hypothetical protein
MFRVFSAARVSVRGFALSRRINRPEAGVYGRAVDGGDCVSVYGLTFI